jgi:hypothetical protein
VSQIVDAHVAYCTAIADLSRDKTELLERIKRLEEAGDALASWTIPNGNSHVDWRKAKEAKL